SIKVARSQIACVTSGGRNDEDVTAHSVFPGFPVTIEQAFGNMGFYFVLGDFFGAFLVAGVVFAFRVNIGRKRQPLAVGRPDRIPGAGRDAGNLFQRAAGNIDSPTLALAITRGNKRELLSVRRPPW